MEKKKTKAEELLQRRVETPRKNANFETIKFSPYDNKDGEPKSKTVRGLTNNSFGNGHSSLKSQKSIRIDYSGSGKDIADGDSEKFQNWKTANEDIACLVKVSVGKEQKEEEKGLEWEVQWATDKAKKTLESTGKVFNGSSLVELLEDACNDKIKKEKSWGQEKRELEEEVKSLRKLVAERERKIGEMQISLEEMELLQREIKENYESQVFKLTIQKGLSRTQKESEQIEEGLESEENCLKKEENRQIYPSQKPVSAFLLYSKDILRKENLKEEDPGNLKLANEKWRNEDQTLKESYERQAQELLAKCNAEMSQYQSFILSRKKKEEEPTIEQNSLKKKEEIENLLFSESLNEEKDKNAENKMLIEKNKTKIENLEELLEITMKKLKKLEEELEFENKEKGKLKELYDSKDAELKSLEINLQRSEEELEKEKRIKQDLESIIEEKEKGRKFLIEQIESERMQFEVERQERNSREQERLKETVHFQSEESVSFCVSESISSQKYPKVELKKEVEILNEKLLAQIEKLESSLREKEKVNCQLFQRVEKIHEKKRKSKAKYEQKEGEWLLEIKEMDETIKNLRENLKKFENKEINSQEESDTKDSKLVWCVQEKNNELKREIETLNERIKDLLKQFKERNEEISELKLTVRMGKKELGEKHEELESIAHERDLKSAKIKELESRLAKNEAEIKENSNKIRNFYAMKLREVIEKSEKSGSMENSQGRQMGARESFKSEKEVNSRMVSNEDMEQKNREIEQLKMEVNSLRNGDKNLREFLDQSKFEIQKLKSEKSQCENELQKVKAQLDENMNLFNQILSENKKQFGQESQKDVGHYLMLLAKTFYFRNEAAFIRLKDRVENNSALIEREMHCLINEVKESVMSLQELRNKVGYLEIQLGHLIEPRAGFLSSNESEEFFKKEIAKEKAVNEQLRKRVITSERENQELSMRISLDNANRLLKAFGLGSLKGGDFPFEEAIQKAKRYLGGQMNEKQIEEIEC